MRPGLDSGRYQKHLDIVLGFKVNRRRDYELSTVGHRRYDFERSQFNLLVRPPTEALNDEFNGDPTFSVKLRDSIEQHELPAAYYSHPVVLGHPDEYVVPLGVYIDGVAYSQTDTVLGFWCVNLISQSRCLLALIRKSLLCRCGCRGWCTLYPLLDWLREQCSCLAAGAFALLRHDRSAWSTQDLKFRADLAGKLLRYKCAILQLRGDWAEHCEIHGLPTWQSNLRPCFECNAFADNMYSTEAVSLEDAPFVDNSDADYDDAATRCEIVLVIYDAQRQLILSSPLRFDKRPDGNRGRCLLHAIPSLGLLAGDRLEPCATLKDVAQLDYLVIDPAIGLRIVFWRVSQETLVRHRSPLWCERIGLTPSRCIVHDLLHAFFLGVMQIWARDASWLVFLSRCFGAFETTDQSQFRVACLAMRGELMSWYSVFAAANPDTNLSRLSDIQPSMFGTYEEPKLKMRGHETYGFCRFLVYLLDKYKAYIPNAGVFIAAGGELLKIASITSTAAIRLTPTVHQSLLDSWLRFRSLMRSVDADHCIPKTHEMMHLIQNATRTPPSEYGIAAVCGS